MRLARKVWIFLLIAGFLTLPASAFTGTGWLPDYSTQLGLRSADSPGVNEEFSQFESLIADPLKLKELAGVEAEAGVKVTISHAGNMRWSTEADGTAVRPAAVRMKIEGQENVLIFLPDQETVKLKLYKRPPFRSSAVPRKSPD